MRKNFFIMILFTLFSKNAFSQQNYFNVPSFIITPKDKIFFQEQINVFNEIESNSTFDYGLGSNLEIGLNFYGLDYKNPLTKEALLDDKDNTFKKMGLVNFLTSYDVGSNQSIAAGGQMGLRISKYNESYFTTMIYCSYSNFSQGRYRFSVGPWFANSIYTKKIDSFGLQIGSEYILIKDRLSVVADSISGDSPMSVTVIGLMYEYIENFPLSFGFQIPNSKVGGQAFVFEFTYNP